MCKLLVFLYEREDVVAGLADGFSCKMLLEEVVVFLLVCLVVGDVKNDVGYWWCYCGEDDGLVGLVVFSLEECPVFEVLEGDSKRCF